MHGILTRWRQFGRRYFWPHLLLGIVAASFGVPAVLDVVLNNVQAGLVPAAANKPESGCADGFTHKLAHNETRLPAAVRCVSFSADGWQQAAEFPVIIHNLSFSLAPQILLLAQANQVLHAQQLTLAGSAYTLLAGQPRVTVISLVYPQVAFTISHWIQKAQGIRAGPTPSLHSISG